MSFRNGLLLVLGLLLAFVIGNAVLEDPPGEMRTVPAHLRGTWVTAHQSYSDRYLTFREDAITFGTGGVSSRTFEVTGFDQGRDAHGRELDTVYFRSVDGSSFSRQFRFSQQGRKTLVFVNQPDVVWTQ